MLCRSGGAMVGSIAENVIGEDRGLGRGAARDELAVRRAQVGAAGREQLQGAVRRGLAHRGVARQAGGAEPDRHAETVADSHRPGGAREQRLVAEQLQGGEDVAAGEDRTGGDVLARVGARRR